jgi:Baseplate J-like protein
MNQPCDCGCCDGPHVVTPWPIANRPGLSKLGYRAGTHGSFFATMQARLSSTAYPALVGLRTRERSDPAVALLDAWATVGDVLTFYQERIANEGYLRTATERRSVLELARLIGYTPRPGVAASVYLAYSLEKDAEPVAIAKGAQVNSVPAPGELMQCFETAEPLDARVEWNMLKPRLTEPQIFKQRENFASTGLYFKGTATNLKPNDPLIVKLASDAEPQFARVKSVEVDSDNDRTRIFVWPASTAHPAVEPVKMTLAKFSKVEDFNVSPDTAMTKRVLAVLDEVSSLAENGDPAMLAAHLDDKALPQLEAEAQAAKDGNFTKLQPWVESLVAELKAGQGALQAPPPVSALAAGTGGETSILGGVVNSLQLRPSIPPASAKQLQRDVARIYAPGMDTIPRLLATVQPALAKTLYISWKNLAPARTPQLEVYALRIAAAPFGHNAPPRLLGIDNNKRPQMGEWLIEDPFNLVTPNQSGDGDVPNAVAAPAVKPPQSDHHEPAKLYLDNDYTISPGGFVAITTPNLQPHIITPKSIVQRSLTAYGMSGKTVLLNLSEDDPWIATAPNEPFSTVRGTRVFAGSEKLELAEAPITTDISGSEIELGDLYDGLQPGRWLIVAGERSDIIAENRIVPGVKAAELVMISAVEQRTALADGAVRLGDKIHTFITLAKSLAYHYRRDTVTIYGNVVRATHGETRKEVLGSGDASKPLQTFTLKQPPLTFVSAPTVSGVSSTLEVRVNEVMWHETDMFASLAPQDRKFVTRTDDDSKTSLVFGDGNYGLRLPTGVENIKATYRSGIGKAGNVKAGQLSLLSTRPLGVKEVINPIRASGGADKESRDQARKNAPLALMALDRLVSTRDYADFSRTFAGIGKAVAVPFPRPRSARDKAAALVRPDQRRRSVQVTIAGAEDAPIEVTSDLYRNLYDALHRFGDPYLPIELVVRERSALVISAKVKIDPDYQWETLEPKIRAAVLDRFSFENQDLGEDVFLSDAINAIQAVRGVVYVDVDIFDAISEAALLEGFSNQTLKNPQLADRIPVEPTQIAYLPPEVPDTLILQELKP